jgi:hypothetical protein
MDETEKPVEDIYSTLKRLDDEHQKPQQVVVGSSNIGKDKNGCKKET